MGAYAPANHRVMVTVGITGGAGYVAGELIRLLLRHPDVELRSVRSESHAGEPLHRAHPDLVGETSLCFSGKEVGFQDLDVLFLCSGHGASRSFLEQNEVPANVRVIDLSNDFRLRDDADFLGRRFIYGLPELARDEIRRADSIANPGCFATLIQLALLPLAAHGLLNKDVHVNAVTGSTGAGAGLARTTHFTWRTGNVSVYKPFTHQHLGEILQTVSGVQPGYEGRVRFIPVRGNFTRGIFASLYTECEPGREELDRLYRDFYADHPFTVVTDSSPDLKPVVNTNKCVLHVDKHEDQVLVTGGIDNLLKGAAGQAVQNMNLMFGLDEKAGLHLKATAH